jgi:hypothetical protein
MVKRYKLPSTLRIGAQTFRVRQCKMPEGEETWLGTCEAAHGHIRIARGQEPHQKADTLLHEVLHAVWYGAALSEVKHLRPHEELVVRAFTAGLAQVLRDNPRAVASLVKALRA